MGAHSANEWMDEAIRGEDVPASQRSEYSPSIIFDVGSANITVMCGANDAWFSWFHDRSRHAGIIEAWHRYPTGKGARYAFQSEVFGGVFRYRNWQMKAFVSMDCHAEVIGDGQLKRDMSQVIRYAMFLSVLSCGWWKTNKTDGKGGTYLVAWAGARSYVGPEDPGGGRSHPYAGICEVGGMGDDFSNVIGSRNEASWEVEPLLRVCEQTHGYKRWNMFSSSELDLMRRLVKTKDQLGGARLEDLQELARLLEECEYVSHVGVHLFKTDEGAGFLCVKSWASGSTSFKDASIVVKDGVDKREYREPYADDIDDTFGWMAAHGTLNRKSDVGGTAGFAVYEDRVEMFARTNAGAAANGFEPGPGRHFEQWRGQGQDLGAWPEGDRLVTLPGRLIWHCEIRQKKSKVEIHYPATGPGPDPDPDPDPGDPDMSVTGTKFSLRVIARGIQLLEKHGGNVSKAKKEADTDQEYQNAFGGWLKKWKEENQK